MKRFRQSAQWKRITHIESLAQARLDAGMEKGAHATQQLLRRERERANWRLIKIVNGGANMGSIPYVVTVDEQGHTTQVHDKVGVEDACLKCNATHFNQAAHTPLLQPPLANMIGAIGTTPFLDSILAGDARLPENTDEYICKVIDALAKPPFAPKPLLWSFSLDDHIQGWRKAREHTSSSFSGIQFGYYMAGTYDKVIAQVDYNRVFPRTLASGHKLHVNEATWKLQHQQTKSDNIVRG